MSEKLETIRAATRDAIRQAKADREHLVPVLGAGTSISLGAPSWNELVNRLAETAGIENLSEDPVEAMESLKRQLGDRAFERAVQHELSLPATATSLTLQTLVQASPSSIVTTNLDYAIENAFRLGGRPLEARNILYGIGEDLSLFGPHASGTQLLKLHGSLERPWTWVLTTEDYDRVYARDSRASGLFKHIIRTPLFIGFSLNDQDLAMCLRMAQAWNRPSYALVSTHDVGQRRAAFARFGVIAIPFDSFDQVPEVLDEVFDAEPPRVRIVLSPGGTNAQIEVGAAAVGWPLPEIESEALDGTDETIAILRNAVDGRPMQALTDRSVRRDSGQKGDYLNGLVRLLDMGGKSPILDAVVSGLCTYSDLFFGRILPHVLTNATDGLFEFLTIARNQFPSAEKQRLERDLLRRLEDRSIAQPSRRDLAKVLALANLHPAQATPPVTMDVEGLRVCKYPLTRYQVGQLCSDVALIEERSVRPFTLRAWRDAETVLEKLRATTRLSWRLPTRAEWETFAHVGGDMWPWGNDGIRHLVHAHLNFKGRSSPNGPIEVGCFPQGASPEGLLDLIGNVYDLLDAEREKLAGGAWTTEVREGQSSAAGAFVMFGRIGSGSGNIGIRPVVSLQQDPTDISTVLGRRA